MSNETRGVFELDIGGKPYRFKIGTAALIAAQEQIGRDTGTVPTIEAMMEGIRDKRLLYWRDFLWAALQQFHSEITIADMADLLDTCSEMEAAVITAGLVQSMHPDPRDLETLEAAGNGARPTPAPAPGPRPAARAAGRVRSTLKHARPA